jgi:SAM-dependent methyltransferase
MRQEINFDEMKSFFGEALDTYGTTALGANWNSKTSQELRFEQLVKLCDRTHPFSMIDYGCGYGAMINYLTDKSYTVTYMGYDLLESMVEKARELFKGRANCTFTTNLAELQTADYVVSSGIFNIRFQYAQEIWTEYVLETLHKMNDLSSRGFSFNMLTKYSDADHMRPHLYYADPGFLFDYCKTHFSRNVALLHDYDLYDFTILVKKQL